MYFKIQIQGENIYQVVREIIANARQRVYRMANSALLETYWEIGKTIVEDEQNGALRAAYGKATLKLLAQQLTLEFGKGFDERNLNNMRAFYQAFPIWNALRTNLSWTHYRLLSRLETEQKRIITLANQLHLIRACSATLKLFCSVHFGGINTRFDAHKNA